MKLTSISFLFILFATDNALGQSIKTIEKDLVTKIKNVNHWAANYTYTEQVDRDKELTKANQVLAKSLLDYTSKNVGTFNYDFPQLKKHGMSIVSSSDKKFKIYSWDDGQGGTERFWEVIYQYKTTNSIKSSHRVRKYNEDVAGYFTKIENAVLNNKIYYLAFYRSTYMSSYYGQTVQFFCFTKDELITDAPLIKSSNKINSDIRIAYWPIIQQKNKDLIAYNDISKTITIPLSEDKHNENGYYTVINKMQTYKFNGRYFALMK
nr:hypothetical protein [Pedobacter sp. ASV2]